MYGLVLLYSLHTAQIILHSPSDKQCKARNLIHLIYKRVGPFPHHWDSTFAQYLSTKSLLIACNRRVISIPFPITIHISKTSLLVALSRLDCHPTLDYDVRSTVSHLGLRSRRTLVYSDGSVSAARSSSPCHRHGPSCPKALE